MLPVFGKKSTQNSIRVSRIGTPSNISEFQGMKRVSLFSPKLNAAEFQNIKNNGLRRQKTTEEPITKRGTNNIELKDENLQLASMSKSSHNTSLPSIRSNKKIDKTILFNNPLSLNNSEKSCKSAQKTQSEKDLVVQMISPETKDLQIDIESIDQTLQSDTSKVKKVIVQPLKLNLLTSERSISSGKQPEKFKISRQSSGNIVSGRMSTSSGKYSPRKPRAINNNSQDLIEYANDP